MDPQEAIAEAAVHHRAGRLADAERNYRHVLERLPEHSGVLYYLGTIEFQRGALAEAREHLARSCLLNPAFADAWEALGRVLLELGEFGSAIDAFDAALVRVGAKLSIRVHRAAALRSVGRLAEAQNDLLAVLGQQPDHALAHINLALVRFAQDEIDKAFASCFRALEIDPRHPISHYVEGLLQQSAGNHEEAVLAFRYAAQLDPRQVDARVGEMDSLLAMGDLPEALSLAQDTIERFSRSLVGRLSAARVRRKAGRYVLALDDYQVAATLDPTSAEAFAGQGASYVALGRLNDAIHAYQSALAACPEDVASLAALADVEAKLGNLERAIALFEDAARRQPDNRAWRLRRATLGSTVPTSASDADAQARELERQLDSLTDEPASIPFAMRVAARCHPPALDALAENVRPIREKYATLFGSVPSSARRGNGGRLGILVAEADVVSFSRLFAPALLASDHLDDVLVFAPPGAIERLRPALAGSRSSLRALPPGIQDARGALERAGLDVLFLWNAVDDPFSYFIASDRVAPLQCTSWGTRGTSGAPGVDVYLSSQHVESAITPEEYTEKLVLLPGLPIFPTESSSEANLDEKSVRSQVAERIVGCPAPATRIHPRVDAVFLEILAADLGAAIVFASTGVVELDQRFVDRLTRGNAGLATRIAFAESDDRNPFGWLRGVDVVLDPPGGGELTGIVVGLQLGKPIVTCSGATAPSRRAAGILRAIGIESGIVGAPSDLARLAVHWAARNAERRANDETRNRRAWHEWALRPQRNVEIRECFGTLLQRK